MSYGFLVILWVYYAYLDRPKGFYLVRGWGFYLVKGRCFYLVKGFCPIFGVDIAFFAISFFGVFSNAFSEKTNVRLDVHRFDADCLAKVCIAPTFLRSLATLWNIRKLNEEIQYAFLVAEKVNLSK